MADIKSKLTELYSIEQLSIKNTAINKLHPCAKIIASLVYIICVVSVGKYDFYILSFYFFYPAIMIALAEIPFGMIIKRAFIALPFCIFAGVSNIIFDKSVMFSIGQFHITGGVCSFITIILKSFLCVSAVLTLIASTPFQKIIVQLKRMYIPDMVLILIEMIYRYIGVLMKQTDIMLTAYRMRSPYSKFPNITDMGSFVGRLFLHSADRAERIYNAMKCRGYGLADIRKIPKEKMRLKDFMFIAIVILSSAIFLIVGR